MKKIVLFLTLISTPASAQWMDKQPDTGTYISAKSGIELNKYAGGELSYMCNSRFRRSEVLRLSLVGAFLPLRNASIFGQVYWYPGDAASHRTRFAIGRVGGRYYLRFPNIEDVIERIRSYDRVKVELPGLVGDYVFDFDLSGAHRAITDTRVTCFL